MAEIVTCANCGKRNRLPAAARGVARCAAEHLLSRGLRHFGFTGWAAGGVGVSHWETRRRAVFLQTLKHAGF